MRKTLLLLIISLGSSAILLAQPRHGGMSKEKREKVESMKVAFITRKLDITPDEARVFWPVYNQMSDELQALREKRRQEMKSLKADSDSLTDKEYERIFDSDLQFRQSELDIMKKYHPQFKKVLPMKKLARLPRVEDEFRQELLEKIQERGGKPSGDHKGKGR